LLAGDRLAAAKEGEELGTSNLPPSAILARFAALPTAPASEWEARAAHFFAAPQLSKLRLTALGYALILDGKKQAALAVWEEIGKQSSAGDFFSRAVVAHLKGEPVEHAAPPDSVNLNEFAAIPDKL
jgi:hypothetical protein